MKLRGTWYRVTFEDGSSTSVSCCPDCGTVSLAWNMGYRDLRNWTEQGLKEMIEESFGKKVAILKAS